MSASYIPPLDDIRFVVNEVLNISEKTGVDVSTINESLDLMAKMSQKVIQPTNATGDKEGCTYDEATKSVKTPAGFKEAYEQFRDAGFTAFNCSSEYGGLDMPLVLGAAQNEMISSANLSFGMYPGLTHSVYTALEAIASKEQKDKYLPKFVSGEWFATMCLTEPEAGTDLGLIQTKAVKKDDGSYELSGTKIFISAGKHDLKGKIVHLVLARTEGAPEGTKGLSLFIVPESNDDDSSNGVTVEGIEHKMGLNGSPTCTINFKASSAQLVGNLNEGMRNMFIVMNEARLGVGLQGLALAEIAYQNAVEYAKIRIQSMPIDQDPSDQTRTAIINLGDVRRELLTIKADVEGGRMLAYWTMMQLDIANKNPGTPAGEEAKNLVALLTPIVKAHLTDNAEENTSGAVQVWGGHGYIKDNGMEQFSRDARITRLYEGTNGVQAMDLLGFKVMTKGLLPGYLKELEADLKDAKARGVAEEFTKPVEEAAEMLKAATAKLQSKAVDLDSLNAMKRELEGVSTNYLKLASHVVMGHMWVKMVNVSQQRLGELGAGAKEAAFYDTKIKTGRVYMQESMPDVLSLAAKINNGAASLRDIANENFAHKNGSIGKKAYKPKAANANKKPPGPKAA